MCGIAGSAGLELEAGRLSSMMAAVAHRGPDEQRAFVVPGRVDLGFQRLSVVDLTTGSQPLASEDESVVVTCNGEIYNAPQLRRELQGRGHVFRSRSDVEVIVHLYEEVGERCLDRLQGMFAIALWDARREELLLARDRLGVKPLYFAAVDRGLLYGSEPGAILASGRVSRAVDPGAIARYLTLQYVPAPRTGFAAIEKLAPGELLRYRDGRIERRRWWRLEHEPSSIDDPEEALAAVDELLRDATRSRLLADVPLGAFLSGGIDSTLVVSYMAEALQQVRTFSIDFAETAYSEGVYARRIAEQYGTDHLELTVEADLVPMVARATRVVGEPFADSSAVPTYALSELTRRYVTVALSGDGGDEAFGGYWRYRRALRAERAAPARPLARALAAVGGARVDDRVAALALTRGERYAAMMSHFAPRELEQLAEPAFLDAAGGSRVGWSELGLGLGVGGGVDPYLRLDVETYLPGALLTKVDRMSMAHALEVRSPFLDYRMHELAQRLSSDLKIRGTTSKWILRELARRRGIPEDVALRPKKGFSMPVGAWLRGRLRPWLEELVLDEHALGRGYFRPQEVRRLVDEHADRRRDHTSRLWNLAMLELWHREWVDA